MSGHSKWSTIKRKKAANDAKKGAIFTKMVKLISSAVKTGGGGDPEQNLKLKLAIDKAKGANMPVSNIENAIKKATGEANSGEITYEIRYEGYAPGGVAVIVDALTENKNRTAAEVRHMFSKNGGSLGESGSVSWMFHPKGIVEIPTKPEKQEELSLQLMEVSGVEDMEMTEDRVIVTTSREDYDQLKQYCEEQELEYDRAEVTMIPENTVPITDLAQAKKVLKTIEMLEENDDIQEVFFNAEIDDAIAAQLD